MAIDFRISGTSSNIVSECDIRVDPNDTDHIIAAANDTAGTQAQFASTDGGTTWTQTSLALQTGDNFHSDPAVDWTSDGTAWAITIGVDASVTVLKLRAYTSADNGGTWTFHSTPSGTTTNVDREIMWVDHSLASTYKDQIYLTYHTGTPVQFVRRTTGTSAAWQTPIQVSGSETTGVGIGGDVKSNANGDVFVFWQDADGSRNIYMAKSTDGGATFGSVVTVASIFATSRKLSIPADSGRKSRVYVSAAVYRTATKDLAYVVWPDLSGESGCTTGSGPGTSTSSACKTRIWFARSVDGGSTWSSPVMLNNQSGKNDQAFSKIAVDETDGKLVVVYYDTVNDSNRVQTELFMQTSVDDGVSWSTAERVSSGQTDETASSANSGNQYGDYIGLSGHAGTFYPAWTDRRNGANEEIWSAKIALVQKACAFIVERSTLGQDEIDARRSHPGGATVPDAFRFVIDGFTAAQLGLSSTADTLTIASPVSGLHINCTGNTPTLGNYGPAVQRFTFHYTLDFGPDDTAFSFPDPTLTFTVAATLGGLTAAADLELIKQPNPFILHGDPPWLSIDVRVFPVKANETKFGVTMGADASQAPIFIQQAMAALSAGGGTANGESFQGLDSTENGSALTLLPTDSSGTRVFNFALARVRYIGLIGATDVRMFFRLFQAQTTSAAYDRSTTYRQATNPHGHPIALAGIRNNEYVTLPFFAAPRVDSAAVGMDQQTDDPFNVQTFVADPSGNEVDRFFGCWLDINQPTKPNGTPNNVLPATVPATAKDGPFNDAANPPLPIQQAIVRNLHQCLIAEIAFDPVAIPDGKDPGNWDKLAQRNLAWSAVPNPGVDGSRRALDTFEMRATPVSLPAGLLPDELMIDWGTLPEGSIASIFLPDVDAAAVVATATKLYTTHRLTVADAHTIECTTGGITYVPIPPATDVHFAGLLSVDLPPTIRKGQEFSVLVRQVTNTFGLLGKTAPGPGTSAGRARVVASANGVGPDLSSFANVGDRRVFFYRKVLGAFQLTIPVHTKEVMLLQEERSLSVLRWIAPAIPTGNRWYRIFQRYLEHVGGRVSGFGGDPGQITPSPTGDGVPPKGGTGSPGEDERHVSFTGKVIELLFDRYGDFTGFRLDTEDGVRAFHAREHQIEHLAQRAWAERILVRVAVERHAPTRPERIVLLYLPGHSPSSHHR
jgi:hypothetical protein